MTARHFTTLCALVGAAALAPAAPAADKPSGAKPAEPVELRKATVANATLEDPVERLRQRLAERLGGGRVVDGASAAELRLTSKASRPAEEPPRAAVPSERPRRTVTATKPATAAKAAGQGSATPWGYEGAAGPAAWGGLQPEFATCRQGQRQSPIDIRDGLAVDLEAVRFEYQASPFAVIDTGRTLQVNVAAGNHIDLGGRRFELRRVQFHRPAEHRIDGRSFEMTAHLIHEDEKGRLAVVAVLLDPGPAQPAVQTVWNHIPLEKNEEIAARVRLDPSELLPSDRRYYTYMGSLTTPPCSEGVQWVVMRTPVTMAPEQIELFARIYPMNARPLQAAGDRRILQSN